MDLIKLLDVANPKKIKTTINALITTYEGFDDEIRATAKSAVDIANAAKTIAQSAEDTAADAKSIVTTANTNASAAKQTSEEALAMIEQADARSQEATTTAETALTNANDATSTAELAMNVATEAKSTVDQAISTGVFGTFVHNPAGISLLHAYMTHNLAQEDTDENFYIATPKLVRTALTEYYTKTQTDDLLANLDLSSYPTKTELKEYSYPVTADDAWIYNSTTKKLGGSGGSVSNTYSPLQGSTQNFGTLARVSQVSRIATAHNDLVDTVNNKQDKLTAGDNITINDSNVISAAKTSVVQETGTSTESVMSQKATTDELAKKIDKTGGKFTGEVKFNEADGSCINYDTSFYINKKNGSTLCGTNGTNAWIGTPDTALTMRGNATRPTYNGTDLGLKSDIPTVSQTTGTSTTDVMSQKSVTDELAKKQDEIQIVELTDGFSSISISKEEWNLLRMNTEYKVKYSNEEYVFLRTEATTLGYIHLFYVCTSFDQLTSTKRPYLKILDLFSQENSITATADLTQIRIDHTYLDIKEYYPVGSIYLSTSATSPASFIGGSWELLDADAYFKIVTANAGQLGGVSNHKISISNMPSHSHKIASSNSYSNDIIGYGYNASSQGVGGTKTNKSVSYYTSDRSGNQVIENTGSGTAYYPYYYGVYAWKRTN